MLYHMTHHVLLPLWLPHGCTSSRGSHTLHAMLSHVIYHFYYIKKNCLKKFWGPNWQSRSPTTTTTTTTWTMPRPSKKNIFFQNLNFLSQYKNFITILLCVTYIMTIFLFTTTYIIYYVLYYCVTYILLYKKAVIKLFYYTVYIVYIILKYILFMIYYIYKLHYILSIIYYIPIYYPTC